MGEHHRAGATAPLAAAYLGPDKADAVQVVHQHDQRVRVGEDDFAAIEPEDELAGVRDGSPRIPGRASLSGEIHVSPRFLLPCRPAAGSYAPSACELSVGRAGRPGRTTAIDSSLA